MKLNFLERINVKLVLTQCLYGFLLIFAFALIGLINDIELVNLAEEKGVKEAIKQIDSTRITKFQIWLQFMPLIGILIATVISSVVFFKRNLFWLNSIFVFIGLLLFNYFGFFRLDYIKYIADLMNLGLVINVILSSSILIIIAFGLYYYSYRISKNEN